MHTALIKRRVANLAPAGGRGFRWYSEGISENRANAGIAPDGTNTAVKVAANTTTNPHYIYGFAPNHAPAVPLNAPYTYSVFVKGAGWRYVTVNYQWYYTPHFIWLDLQTGAVVVPPVGRGDRPRAYRVETLPDGWYRVSITEANTASGDMNPGVALVDANGNQNTPGDSTSGVLLWGYQINPGGPAPYNPALPPA